MSGFSALMDGATAKHLDAWLSRSVPERLRDAALDLILSALDEHPDLIQKGRSWAEIRDVGERMCGKQ